jgi:hypothetical protein
MNSFSAESFYHFLYAENEQYWGDLMDLIFDIFQYFLQSLDLPCFMKIAGKFDQLAIGKKGRNIV